MYVTQLLPDDKAARIIRDALREYRDVHSDDDSIVDVCLEFELKITTDLRKK